MAKLSNLHRFQIPEEHTDRDTGASAAAAAYTRPFYIWLRDGIPDDKPWSLLYIIGVGARSVPLFPPNLTQSRWMN